MATPCGPILIGVQPHTIAVTGTVVINARPDEAVIYLGVQTNASSANAALRLNASRTTAVLQALARAGVARRDVATAAAVADARSQDEALAVAAGGTLGQVVSIDATSGGAQIYARDAAGVAAPGVPTPIVPPQSVQAQVVVTVVWALQG